MKKLSKQQIARWGSVASLAALTVLFTQCIPSASKKSSGYSSPVEVSSPGGLEKAEAEAPSIGVKDSDRILYTMAAVTGIDPASNGTIRNAFTNLRVQLPANSRLESLSENQMVTVTKLAAEFCNQLIQNNPNNMRTTIWPMANFTGAWMTAFPNSGNMDQRGTFIAATLERFWGVNVLDELVYEESYNGLMELFSLMLEGDPFGNPAIPAAPNNATSTLNATKAVCTAALSSAPVWMN